MAAGCGSLLLILLIARSLDTIYMESYKQSQVNFGVRNNNSFLVPRGNDGIPC